MYRRLLVWAVVACATPATAQTYTQNYDTQATFNALTTDPNPANNWAFVNNSTSATPTGQWQFGGTTGPTSFNITANNSAPGSNTSTGAFALATNQASSSFNVTGVTISDWMITPAFLLTNGTTLTFFTRASNNGTPVAERLEIRLSLNGLSTNVGTTPESVGDFGVANLSPPIGVNPGQTVNGYPLTYTRQTYTVVGLPQATAGRFAFRHYVTDSGTAGPNGFAIGVDDITITPVFPAPEPGLLVGIGMVGAGVLARRRGRATLSA